MNHPEQISWIGCGKVGRTLARALKNAGYGVGAVICKTADSARKAIQFIGAGKAGTDAADALLTGTIHFITTNDDAIAGVVSQLDSVAADLKGHYFFRSE